jgi:formyltetrahydrofolate-dependent phosphoribosylglycinamide formyltransferase
MTTPRKRTAILISGRGSNMSALLAAAGDKDYPAEIVGVLSDKENAAGLGIATASCIPVQAIPRSGYASNDAHDEAIDKALSALRAEIVVLAGYMRLLTSKFVEKWQGRMINIHPSLLPSFKGLDTHKRALDAGMRVHGCTVHFVTSAMDDGPIIAQAAVPVLVGDSENDLIARVLKAEHRLYPQALKLVAQGRARMDGGRTVFSGFADDSEKGTALITAPSPLEEGSVDLEQLARITP